MEYTFSLMSRPHAVEKDAVRESLVPSMHHQLDSICKILSTFLLQPPYLLENPSDCSSPSLSRL